MRNTQFYQGNCQVAVGQADGQLSQKTQLQLEKKSVFHKLLQQVKSFGMSQVSGVI